MTRASETLFAALYDTYSERIYEYCRRRTTLDRLDDAVADTFLTVWRKLADVPDEPETLPWLYGVAYRVLLNHWRSGARKRRLVKKLRSLGVEAHHPADHVVIVRHEVQMALAAASRLNPNDLEVLRLAVWEELPQRQIALVLGISHGAVRQRLLRARSQLLKEFEHLEGKRSLNPTALERGAP